MTLRNIRYLPLAIGRMMPNKVCLRRNSDTRLVTTSVDTRGDPRHRKKSPMTHFKTVFNLLALRYVSRHIDKDTIEDADLVETLWFEIYIFRHNVA